MSIQALLQHSSSFYIWDIIGFLIIYQSIVFAIFLLIKKKSKTIFSNTLEIIYLLIFMHFLYIQVENNWLDKSYMLGLIFGSIYGPIFYLYTKSLVLKQVDLKRYRLHFFPSVIVFLIVLLSNLFKSHFMIEHQAILSILISIHIFSYLISSLYLLKNYRRILPQVQSTFDKISLNWLRTTIYIIIAAIFFAFADSILGSYISSFENLIITLIFALILVLVNSLYYLGSRQVELFSGFASEEIEMEQQTSRYEIPSDEKIAIAEKLIHCMETKQLFKEFELSLNDLAHELDISSRKISFIINDIYKMNFFEYINSYRIKVAKQLLDTTSRPVKEIMYDSGFGNKSTFNATFKKYTGQSPSTFRKIRT